MLRQIFLALEQAIDFLSSNKNDRGVPFPEFVDCRLELSQLLLAVGSPRAADEDHDRGTFPEVRKIDTFAIDGGKREFRSGISSLERVRRVFEHPN